MGCDLNVFNQRQWCGEQNLLLFNICGYSQSLKLFCWFFSDLVSQSSTLWSFFLASHFFLYFGLEGSQGLLQTCLVAERYLKCFQFISIRIPSKRNLILLRVILRVLSDVVGDGELAPRRQTVHHNLLGARRRVALVALGGNVRRLVRMVGWVLVGVLGSW